MNNYKVKDSERDETQAYIVVLIATIIKIMMQRYDMTEFEAISIFYKTKRYELIRDMNTSGYIAYYSEIIFDMEIELFGDMDKGYTKKDFIEKGLLGENYTNS